jgi:predicted peroxiredoxin
MNDLQKLIDKVIDKAVVGCDTYKHNGSTWLLFTDDKKWVIELTKEGTLWYNYYFFQKLFKVIALDVVENQHYITKWVEDTVINGVKSTRKLQFVSPSRVEDTVINGVKSTCPADAQEKLVEDTVINGVKETKGEYYKEIQKVEYTIQNGVKVIHPSVPRNCIEVEDAIQNGVKHTSNRRLVVSKDIEDTIQNGVKRTLQKNINRIGQVEDAIKNGVKKTYSDKIPHEYDWSKQFTEEIDDIIQNGVKHTEKSLQIDGSCVIEDVIKEGVIEHGIKETKSEVATREWKAGEVINGGVKKTTPGGYLGSVERKGKMVHQFEHSKQDDNVEDVIKSGIKATTTNLPLSQDDGQIAEIEDVIKNGIKKTEAAALFDEESKMDTVISNGIKETIPVVPGDILDTIDFMSYNNTTNVQHLISDVIEKGIKETHDDVMPHTGRVEGVIKNGVKKTVDALSSRLPNPVLNVIKNGVKECMPSRTPLYNPMDFSVQYRENHRLDDVASVLEKGIKEVQPLPAQDGNMDYSIYYYRQGESGKPHTKYVDDVITNGIKETKPMDEWVNTDRIVDGVTNNGIKDKARFQLPKES